MKAKSIMVPLWIVATVQGRVIYVDNDGPADFDNIQAVVNDCDNGDVIVFATGIYIGHGNYDIDFKGKEIIVRSTEPNNPHIVDKTIVDFGGKDVEPHRAFIFSSG